MVVARTTSRGASLLLNNPERRRPLPTFPRKVRSMRSIRLSAFAVGMALLSATTPAEAIDFPANALVSIVEGITISENVPMNFGTLALNNGDVIISPASVVTDLNNLTADATAQTNAEFTVTSVVGAQVNITMAPGAGAPAGLSLSAFSFDIGGGTTTNPYTIGAPSETLLVGATLTVDPGTASTGASQSIPYTLTVAFN